MHGGGGTGNDRVEPVSGVREVRDVLVDAIALHSQTVEELGCGLAVDDARYELGDRLTGQTGGVQTTDEDPARVALVQHVTLAFLRHVTGIDHTDWERAQSVLADAHPLGRLESK
ncbi:hypothetical protein ACLMAJ_28945 [Nocardia sp. KC 131]|uniref:hypothetical protein n=1 Tax=Nocardia arseniciresistens TaxID=3392119 RepID=UPI00398F2400